MLDPRHRPFRRAAVVLLALALAACGSAGAIDETPSGTIGGVGVLPDQAAGSPSPSVTTAAAGPTSSTSDIAAPTLPPEATIDGSTLPPSISQLAKGNKLLMVGDSIFAGTAARYGNEACTTLVPLNWQVDVEAESGRAIDFGEKTVRQMMPQGWDVVVFFMGTNYGGNEVGYRDLLVKSLDTIGPDTPVLILTTTRYAAKQDEVNTAIREEAATRPNVTVFDWGAMSEEPGMLAGDGYHPSNKGRAAMVNAIAYLVGVAPTGPGKCLQSKNSADIPNTPGAPTTGPKGGGGSSATTKPPATTPKTTPRTSPATAPVTAAVTTTTRPAAATIPATTRPPATTPTTPAPTPPPTNPPATNPPPTNPPATNPPATNPPSTNPPDPPDEPADSVGP